MYKGIFFLTISAFTFSLATVFVKKIVLNSAITAYEITFFRFFIGLIFTSIYIIIKKKNLRPNNIKYISMRAIFNTIAVIFFFLGIQYTTISKANLLNMTYPFFVFLLAPFINKEKISYKYYLFLIFTTFGIYLTIIPGNTVTNFKNINIGDIFSLISGIVAGFSITSLREARKFDDSYLIIFYLMLFGTIINTFFIIGNFIVPEGTILILIILTALTSLTGQVFITIGYKYINAALGALVSTSRIIFAAFFGILIFQDIMTVRIIIGAAFILLSLIVLSEFWKIKMKKRVLK